MFEEWLNRVTKEYVFNVQISDGGNYFTSKIYTFTDPSGKGLSFKLSLDDQNLPSVFDSDSFPFSHFNKAENVKPNDFLVAAEKCLAGDLIFKRSLFGKYKLEFNLPTFKGYSSAARQSPKYSSYKVK